MFGRRTPASKPTKAKTSSIQQQFDIDNLDELLNGAIPGVDGEADETDLNDPELLKQLQELTSLSGGGGRNDTPHKKEANARQRQAHVQKTQANRAATDTQQQQQHGNADDFDIDSYAALAQGGDDIDVDNVKLDDSDLNDPHLLEMLTEIGGHPMEEDHQHEEEQQPLTEQVQVLMNMGFSAKQASIALEKYDNDLDRATNYLLDAPPPPTDVDDGPSKAMEEAEAEELRPQMMVSKDESVSAADHRHEPIPASEELKQYHGEVDMMEEDEEPVELFNDPEELQRRVKHYQKLAVAAKRAGDKRKAVELLRHSKGLSQRYNELYGAGTGGGQESSSVIPAQQQEQQQQQQDDIMDDTPEVTMNAPQNHPPALADPSSPPQTTPPAPPSPPPKNEIPVPSSAEQSASPAGASIQEVFQQVVQLQKEYKDAAIHYKNIGNLVAAKEMVRVSKELLRVGIQFKNGQVGNAEVVRRKLPGKPDLSLGDGKMRQIQVVDNSSTPGSTSGQTLEHLESQLVYQVDVCHNLAIQSSNSSHRLQKGKTLMDSGNHFQQLEQAFTADLVSLRSRRDQNVQTMPQLHYELVNYTYKNILDHIPVNQMELKIVRGIGLQSLDVPANLEPYVTWDFGGWPPENTAQAALGKGETAVKKGSNPEFDIAVQIPIMRGNRIFMRYVQRRKLTLELFHNRYSYGLFRRPLSLGKIAIPLDSLMVKCSISGTFDVIDANRRKTGGKLEVQLNLREPLTGEDIVRRAERWLVIDEFSQNTSVILASAGLTPMPYQQQQQQQPLTTLSPPPATSTPTVSSPEPAKATDIATSANPLKDPKRPSTPAKSPEPLKSPEPTDSELGDAEEEYNNVDSIVSNMVLEYEMNLVANALASGGGSGKAGLSKDDLLDRKQALDIKMNMLVIQVQTGMLDMDTYLQNVRKRMDRDRQLALVFKKHNRLDLAKGALARKKIMQDEIEEAEAAMAAQQEEE